MPGIFFFSPSRLRAKFGQERDSDGVTIKVAMRFGRIILASLAPLIGLSALMTPSDSPREGADVIVRLWHTMAQWVAAPAAEDASGISLPDHPSLHAVLPVSALILTPFRHSLWMVTACAALMALIRRPRLLLLRC